MARRREMSLRELQRLAKEDPQSLTISQIKALRSLKELSAGGQVADVAAISTAMAAELIGCTQRRLGLLVQDGTIRRTGPGQYDLATVAAYVGLLRTKEKLAAAERDEKAKTDKDVVEVSKHLAAELLGCTQRNVKQLGQDGKIQRTRPGRYDLRSLAAYLREYRDQRYRDETDEIQKDSEFWLGDLRKQNAKLKRLELQMRNGELIQRAEVVGSWQRVGNVLRTAFEAIERRHGRDVGDEIREAIEYAIRDLQPN